MQAAGQVDGVVGLPFHHPFRGEECAAHGQRRRLVHAREGGIVLGADAVGEVSVLGLRVFRRPLHGVDVRRLVSQAQLLIGGHPRSDDLFGGDQPHSCSRSRVRKSRRWSKG